MEHEERIKQLASDFLDIKGTICSPSEYQRLTLEFLGIGIATEEELEIWLDEMVHAAKAAEASKINNSGIKEQLRYLGII